LNPSTKRALSKLNLIRLLSENPEGLSLEELQKVTGHKSISALKKELGELYMIEMYPYTPSDCVEIDFDGERVKIKLPVALNQNFPLTPAEWSILRELVQKHKSLGKNSEQIESILKKINTVIPSEEWSLFEETKSTIIAAIQSKKILEINYWKRSGQESEKRMVAPWILWEESDSYLLGYDLEKKSFRAFRVDCILKIVETKESYDSLPDSAGEWLNGFKQLFSETANQSIMAKVWVTESASFHLNQKMKLNPTGNTKQILETTYYEFSTEVKETNWFVQTVLGYGKSVLVSEPSEIKEMILERLNSITANQTLAN